MELPLIPIRVKNLKNLDKNAFPSLIESNIDLAKNTKSVKKTLTIRVWLNERALAKNI